MRENGSRNHEIGVLTSIGVRKRTILFQILLECCILGAAAFLLAGAVYRPATHVAAGATAEFFSPNKGEEDYKMVYDMPTSTFEIHREISEPVDFEYGITGKTVCLIFFIMLLIVITSALYAFMRIVSRKPKDILLRR